MATFTQTMTTSQKDHFHCAPTDATGKAQPLAVAPTFKMSTGAKTSNPFAGTVTPDADGLGATVVPAATDVDTFTLTIFAQGDPTPGVDDLTDTITYTITAPEDVALNTIVDAPVAQ